jgi:hypothetical protein
MLPVDMDGCTAAPADHVTNNHTTTDGSQTTKLLFMLLTWTAALQQLLAVS